MELESRFAPLPAQWRFLTSKAMVLGYGGAMGGGKSRTLCEWALDNALEYPGIRILICRQAHTSIIETTKKTMIEEVLAPALIQNKKESGGEDYVRLPNKSTFHFIGLDDPVRWFSSQIGLLIFDEAHEIDEEDVVRLQTRLRQPGMPHRMALGFNPENPGHWLQQWFYLGGSQTRFGFYKKELFAQGATKPLGDAEFVAARATDNPHLPDGYVDRVLGGLPEHLRRRYLEGEWLFVTGTGYFDSEALEEYGRMVGPPLIVGETTGALKRDPKDKIRVQQAKNGVLSVWTPPVRREEDENGHVHEAHRYVVSVDVSSGGSSDYSGIQVLDIDRLEQVAEYQGRADPDLVAIEAYRLAKIYNDALIAPEITGGWGFTIAKELQRLRYPRIYTRRVLDRLSQKFTDRLGWDTNITTRAHMLDTLERVLRERSLILHGTRTHAELLTFVRDARGRPAAQPNCHDDLVISLAIAVTIALQRPRYIKPLRKKQHVPQFAATGY